MIKYSHQNAKGTVEYYYYNEESVLFQKTIDSSPPY